ncbi:hypothetical protein MKX01_008923 [Papaver californicum]|nr:hypothetical protein MKX01_008923 [Papaver californicum]
MSSVFRGTRGGDIENGFPRFIPECRQVRVHVQFLILNSHHMSHSLLIQIVVVVFLMATSFRMYAICRQLQARSQDHVVAASGLLGHTRLRGRLQGLRFQLARLKREFDDLDYETLRFLDSDNGSYAPSLSEEEINSLPVHEHKIGGLQSESSIVRHASSSVEPEQKQSDAARPDQDLKSAKDGLTCSVCLEQVSEGEIIRNLPCLHQFHANCIDPWLRQQGTCPLCKFIAGTKWQDNGESGNDVS